MSDYPYTKFAIVSGQPNVGALIRSEADLYQHVDLIFEQLQPLSPGVRRALTKTMIMGWIDGDGPVRQLSLSPDAAPGDMATSLDALSQWALDNGTRLVPAEASGPSKPSASVDVGGTIRRLFGLHALSAADVSAFIGVSAQALSEIQRSNRQPSLNTLQRISEFFDVSTDRLLQATFEDLLQRELADPARYKAVEERIAKARNR